MKFGNHPTQTLFTPWTNFLLSALLFRYFLKHKEVKLLVGIKLRREPIGFPPTTERAMISYPCKVLNPG
jgi:hypothetical protein